MASFDEMYSLPPRDVLFQLVDRDISLIIDNYATKRHCNWTQVLLNAQDRDKLSETQLPPSAQREVPTLPPLRLKKRPSRNRSTR
mmetsp:Transcript_4672/g.8815  ORF Transcript_4672/g.8815 Transcript_4672/m.8815 type:complete len:85 (+) Transcript_4672:242-496(+)